MAATWLAVFSKRGRMTRGTSARSYGVWEEDAHKLEQPLISHEEDEEDPLGVGDGRRGGNFSDDDELEGRGGTSSGRTYAAPHDSRHKKHHNYYDRHHHSPQEREGLLSYKPAYDARGGHRSRRRSPSWGNARVARAGGDDDDEDHESEAVGGVKPAGPTTTSLLGPYLKMIDPSALQSLVTSILGSRSSTPTGVENDFSDGYRRRVKAVGGVCHPATLHLVTPLQTSKARRPKAETLEDLHERALVRMALLTIVMSLTLILAVARHADE